MKRLLRRIAPLLTLALLPSFAQAQEWSSIYERATSAQIDSTAKLLAQFGTDPTLQRWASLSQLIDESSIVQFELEDLFPDPGVLYRGSDQDFAQASTLSELSTVLGSTILSVSAIDTQAEFESLLFALPAGGGATVDSASFDNVFDTNGVLQRTADSTYASITDLAGLNTALGSSIADGAHFGGAFSDLSGTATAGQIPNLATSKITSGTFADARISASSVTQHEAALTVTESQISDLSHFGGAFSNLSGAAVDAQIPNDITIDLATAATALAANGANCSAGQYPLGVDASGAAESCTADDTGTDDQTAAEVTSTPSGDVAASDVDAAIAELASEKIDAADLDGDRGDYTCASSGANCTIDDGVVDQAAVGASAIGDSELDFTDPESQAGWEGVLDVNELQGADEVFYADSLNRAAKLLVFDKCSVSPGLSYTWNPKTCPDLRVALSGTTGQSLSLSLDSDYTGGTLAGRGSVSIVFSQPAGGGIGVSWDSAIVWDEDADVGNTDYEQPDDTADAVTVFVCLIIGQEPFCARWGVADR